MKRWAGMWDIWRIKYMHTGKCERHRPFGKHWCRWENNIEMGFKEII
jgi:hypothetical protein